MANLNAEYLGEEDLRALGVAHVGRGVRVHRSVGLVNVAAIVIGDFVRVDAFTVISAGDALEHRA